MLIINIPLIIFGYRKFGRLYFVKTIIIVIAISLLTDFLSSIFNGFTISDLRIIDSIIGGLLAGSGIGFILIGGGSSSGWTVLAQIISNKFKLPIGKVCFIIVFRDIETGIYGFLTIFIISKTINFIVKKQEPNRFTNE